MTANYWYCDGSDLPKKKVVTMTVGNETEYTRGQIGLCYVIEKHRLITVSISSAIDATLVVSYEFTHTDTFNYDDPIVQTWYGTLTIPEGSTSANEYVVTYVYSSCDKGSNYENLDTTTVVAL